MEAVKRNSLIDWSVAMVTLGGQSKSGDLHLVKSFPNGVLMAVLDGLGHGPEAAAAAKRAVDILDSSPGDGVGPLFRRCHEALRGSRGAVMSLGSLNGLDGTMTWGGVGNVEGLVLHAGSDGRPARESLLLRPGLLGDQMPHVQGSTVSLHRDDTVIFATDGIHSGFGDGIDPQETPQQIAARILSHYSKGNDDALVLVARYLGT